MKRPLKGQMTIPTSTGTPDFPERWEHRWKWVNGTISDPHCYIVRKDLGQDGQAEYDEFVRGIRANGERRAFQWSRKYSTKVYSYLRIGDWEYWVAPVGLVNRKFRGWEKVRGPEWWLAENADPEWLAALEPDERP